MNARRPYKIKRPDRERQRGFTLIEALIVISVTGILLAVGMPELANFSASRASASHAISISNAMRLARSESVKRSLPVTVCPSLSPESANPDCDGGAGDWASGWIIFADAGALNSFDAGDRIIRVQPLMENSDGIISTSPSGGVGVSFFPTGVSIGGQRSFSIKPRSAAASETYDTLGRTLCMDNTGSTRIIKYVETC